MSKFCLKSVLGFTLVVLSFLFLTTSVLAAFAIDSATLNGADSVNVAPSSSVTASVIVSISSPDNWGSTSWNTGSGANCVDHADYSTAGTHAESFSITAPSSIGTYDVSFIAYANSSCGGGISNTYLLSGGIVVSAPTPTPTPTSGPTSTPGPTSAPGATPTPTPTSSSASDDSSTATVIFPAVTLQQAQGLNFSGTASISEGTIDLVEYSLDDGHSWQEALPKDGKFDEISEDYTFSPQSAFTQGTHKILARARSLAQVHTQSSNYAALTITVSPPKVKLDEISPNPTKDQTPTITGSVSSNLIAIAKAEVSFDGGKTWFRAKLSGTVFSLISEKLEDGNYEIIARAIDLAGNTGSSDSQTLIIDIIPPIIGGNMISIGPQVITPDENGIIQTVVGTEIKITTSMKGGVTEAKIITSDAEFPFESIPGTNLWTAKLIFENPGQYFLKALSSDGAGNQTERGFSNIVVEAAGRVYKKDSSRTISDADVNVYFFDSISKTWVLWDGASFEQDNPQTTDKDGKYSFLVPNGKYYLEVNADGFETVRSQILDLSVSTILNFDFSLKEKPALKFTLPIFGEISLSLPSFKPPETISVDPKSKTASQLESKLEIGSTAPTLTLPQLFVEEKDVSSFENKYVLSFVSTWSVNSLEQISIINETHKELEDESVITVFLQESEGAVQTFIRRGRYEFTALADKNGESTNEFPITTLPQHFFVDSTGKLAEIYNGVLTKEKLLLKLNSLE
jgi:hypothetical protein